MPLEPGRTWTYSVRTAYRTFVEKVSVVREISVAGTRGFELRGPMGASRIAWKHDALLADFLPGAAVEPPLPLLIADDPNASRVWQGVVKLAGRRTKAWAKLTQRKETVEAGSATYDTIQSRLVVRAGADEIELLTWFAKGVGVVRQTQRTNGRLDVSLSLVVRE